MNKYLLSVLVIFLFSIQANSSVKVCNGKVMGVGFMPQNGLLSLKFDYRGGIWASIESIDDKDRVLSLLLAAYMDGSTTSIQWKADGELECDALPQWVGNLKIDRVSLVR